MTTASRSEAPTIDTTDLTLATYLTVRGCEGRLAATTDETPDGRMVVCWQFEKTKPVMNLIEQFRDGRSQVEPSEFHRKLTETRRSLFQFIQDMERVDGSSHR